MRFLIVLLLLSSKAFSQCAGFESSTVNPLPINGTYQPGTVVTFCYTMSGYNQIGSNWIDGFDLTLGPGWDLSTLTPTQIPNSCDGQGQWGWYNSVTSSNTGQTFGPGFFYDRFILDGNPGNDFGDWTVSGTCVWTFCFSVQTSINCTNQDLSVYVTAMGDGTSGSWSNQGCPGIPYQVVQAQCSFACNVDAHFNMIQPTCYGLCNGSITTVIDSGVAPFQYIWDNGSINQNIGGLCDGTYNVTITDASGCSAVYNTVINQPDSLYGTLTYDSVSCNGFNDASAQINIYGGTLPYSTLWSNGSSLNSITNLDGGQYSVSITDANNCLWQYNLTIYEPQPLVDSFYSANELCPNANNGWVSVTPYGGTQPYLYSWSTNQLTNLDTGIYAVTITDANGCTLTDFGIVSSDPLINFGACCDTTIYNGENVLLFCDNLFGYYYNWSNGGNSSYIIVSPTQTTTYYINVDNGFGCSYIDSVVVTVLPTSYFYIPNSFTPNGDNINDKFYPIIGEIVRIKWFRIYDRWGELIYNDNIEYAWNGKYHDKDCSLGVYTYYVGYSIYDQTFTKKGNVTLIK